MLNDLIDNNGGERPCDKAKMRKGNNNNHLRRLTMQMGVSSGGKPVIAKAPWWYKWIPEHVKTFFLRDIKILHEEEVERKSLQPSASSIALKIMAMTTENRYLLHPESEYRLIWDIATAVFVLVLIWLVPFIIGFETWHSDSMNTFSIVMDLWFVADLLLNFRTGYVDHGATVMDSKKIAQNYLKTWFAIDFVASIPWEAFIATQAVSEDSSDSKKKATRKSVKMSKYFKIPKLLRMARLLRVFHKYARFYALTLVILWMILTVHVGACLVSFGLEICTGEFFVDLNNDGAYSFVSNDEKMPCEGPTVFSLYAEAIYVCFSLMLGMSPTGGTLGGSIQLREKGAVTITQALKSSTIGQAGSLMYVITTFLMLAGVSEISLVVGHIGIILRDRHLASAVFRSKLDRVKEELKYYRVPWVLQNRVLAYYDYMWVNQKQYDDKITLLTDKGMSSDLRGKLALHLYKDVVQRVSLFSRVDDTFLSKVCMELQTRVFLPGDWIILKGDIGSELYIIARGVCQVFLRDPWENQQEEEAKNKEKEILLTNGQFFGEISLLMEVRRTTSVQTKTICEVNVLVQEIFEEILRESPDFAAEMKSLIVQRKVENFQNLYNENASTEDREMIEDAVNEAIESRQLVIGELSYKHLPHLDDDINEEEGKEEGEADFDANCGGGRQMSAALGRNNEPHTNIPGQMEHTPEEVEVGDSSNQSIGDRRPCRQNLRMSYARTQSGLALGNMGGTGFMNAHTSALEDAHLLPIEEASSTMSNMPVGPLSTVVSPAIPENMQNAEISSHDGNAGAGRQMVGLNDFDAMTAEDLVSQQLGMLQERIDKIYTMLTTKLGRVR